VDLAEVHPEVEVQVGGGNCRNKSINNKLTGEMPEWSNGLPWKGSMPERASRVRIPFSPLQKLSFGVTRVLRK
jgi:hypothetical protein